MFELLILFICFLCCLISFVFICECISFLFLVLMGEYSKPKYPQGFYNDPTREEDGV